MKGKIIEPQEGGYYGLGDWHTHLPLLTTILSRFQPKTILEIGAGMYSTLLFNAYGQGNPEVQITSLENNVEPGWWEKLQWMARSNHQIVRVPEYRLSDWPGPYDLVLIDHDPEMERIPALEYYSDKAGIVVVHDCNYECRYAAPLEAYRHVVHDRRHRFYTTAASNTVDVERWFDE